MRTRKAQAKDPLWLREGVWYARRTVRVGDKSVRLRETSGFREDELPKARIWVRRRISEIENELLFGPAPEPPPAPIIPGFATAADEYARKGGKGGRPIGKQDLNKLLALGEFFDDRPVNELEQEDWASFVDEHLVDPADETVRRWFAMFRAPIRRALAAKGLAFGAFDLPPVGAGRSIFLEQDVADELHACYAAHAHPIVTMLRYQGCRIGEALRLRLPGDISFRRETLTFRLTKSNVPRTVPMNDATARELRTYLGDRDVGPVFLTPAGEAYNDRRLAAQGLGYDGSGIRTAHASAKLRYAVQQVMRRTDARCRHCGTVAVEMPGRENSAKLQLIRPRLKGGSDELHNLAIACAVCAGTPHRPGLHPGDEPRLGWFHVHDWRHHWASWFMMNGGRETHLMELGGWADQRMIKRYVRLSIEHLREAVNLV